MAKRKKRRKNGTFFLGLFSVTAGVFRAFLRAAPLLLLFIVLSGTVFGVRHFLYADSRLAVREVLVNPSDALTPERLGELEKKMVGKNIFRVDVRGVSAALEKNALIKSARVSRMIPSVIRVDIETRKPVGLIRFSPDGKFGLVADDGVVLNVFEKNTSGLVLIEAFGMGAKYPQIGVRLDHPGFEEAVKFIHAFAAHPLAQRESLSRISLDPLGATTVIFGEGPPVKLGRQPASRLLSMEKMTHLLESKERAKIEYIDLQYDNVIVKRRN